MWDEALSGVNEALVLTPGVWLDEKRGWCGRWRNIAWQGMPSRESVEAAITREMESRKAGAR